MARLLLAMAIGFCLAHSASALVPCRITVVEKGTGWPVPMVQLRTTNFQTFVTDNAGVVAFDAPEYMGRETWLDVIGHGYERGKDGFGNAGVRLTPTPGGSLTIEVDRKIIAKRLGRLTGAGIFAESQKLGGYLNWKESGITGSDTVEIAPYQGRLFWAWGDTNVAWYPLGIFNTPSATTPQKPLTAFQPPIGIVYDYFRDKEGKVRGVIPKGDGPVWVTAYTTLLDAQKKEHLVCTYIKVRGFLEVVELGLAEWNPATSNFDYGLAVWKKDSGKPESMHPTGHPAFWKDSNGKAWVYFGEGLPSMRCPATYEAWKNPATWEKVKSPATLEDAADGSLIQVAAGSIAWNAYRQRWVAVIQEKFGKPSFGGELWYAEAKTPDGPWGKAVKILSHDNYTFYNPRLHADFTAPDSTILLFEGTYTAEFADHAIKTPRYNYNQILYRLDLDDKALEPAHLP